MEFKLEKKTDRYLIEVHRHASTLDSLLKDPQPGDIDWWQLFFAHMRELDNLHHQGTSYLTD